MPTILGETSTVNDQNVLWYCAEMNVGVRDLIDGDMPFGKNSTATASTLDGDSRSVLFPTVCSTTAVAIVTRDLISGSNFWTARVVI
jgi:hypothetical protein